MRYYSIFLKASLLVFLFSFINGCDSPTDSKAVSVTAPSLLTPADNAEHVSLTPTFTWSGDADKLEVATNTTFANMIYSTDVTGGQHTLPSGYLQANQEYFWRAGKTSSGTTYWSSTNYRFRTN